MFYRIMESFLMRLKIILDVDFYYNKDLFFRKRRLFITKFICMQ